MHLEGVQQEMSIGEQGNGTFSKHWNFFRAFFQTFEFKKQMQHIRPSTQTENGSRGVSEASS